MAERFIRTWKNKICKYMILVSKNLYINTVSKYNNTYHNTIKTNPVDVKSSKHIDFNKENNEEDLKFKVGYRLKKLKYKSLFAKYYNLNWSEEIFVIKKIKNTVLWPYFLVVWTVKRLWEHFTKKNYKKKIIIIIIIIKKNLGLKKSSRENVINHMLIGKVMAILLKAGLIKKYVA